VGRPRWRRSLNQHGTAKHASQASHLPALLHARTEQLFRAPKPQMRVRRGQGSPASAAVVCVCRMSCVCVWDGMAVVARCADGVAAGKNKAHVMLRLEGAVAEPASLLPLPCPARLNLETGSRDPAVQYLSPPRRLMRARYSPTLMPPAASALLISPLQRVRSPQTVRRTARTSF
jgi:hypothetical protein